MFVIHQHVRVDMRRSRAAQHQAANSVDHMINGA